MARIVSLLEELFDTGGYNPETGDTWDGNTNTPTENYSPDQPRDEHGRFASGGGGDLPSKEGLSKAGKEAVEKNITSVKVHRDSNALTSLLQGKHGAGVKAAHREATYDRSDKTLHLTKGASESAVAHELGHAIDGPHEYLSNDPTFVRAFAAEAHKLSGYATTHRSEGLAELFRLRHEKGKEAVEKLAPRMTKALGEHW